MAFVLIDGVLAHDEFAAPPDPSTTQLIEGFAPFQTPTSPGTSGLVEGFPSQEFSAPADPSAAPVDGVLGLTTWEAASTVEHAASGALVGQFGSLEGSATHQALHAASGVLAGQPGVLAGSSLRTTPAASFSSSGALVGPGSVLGGSALRSSPVTAPLPSRGGGPTRKHKAPPPLRDEFAESLLVRYKPPVPSPAVPPETATLAPVSKAVGQTRPSVLAKFSPSPTIDLTKLVVQVEESIPDEVFLLALL